MLRRWQDALWSRADLSPVPLGGLPRELQVVGDDVNRLLGRLDEALHVERALATNAAHELRSPLAAVRLRLQTALDGELAREDVQDAIDSLRRLSHRAEKLLQLSRAESGQASGRGRVALRELAAVVLQEFSTAEGNAGRLAPVEVEHGVVDAAGDIDSLAIALRNLVENALRDAGGSRVEVRIAAPCTLVVTDEGPGVPATLLDSLALRHVRHSSHRTGFGLGLSIVRTIVEKHGGSFHVASPAPGRSAGFEARIVLRPWGDQAR